MKSEICTFVTKVERLWEVAQPTGHGLMQNVSMEEMCWFEFYVYNCIPVNYTPVLRLRLYSNNDVVRIIL